jgi:hypothetical protein
MKILILIAGLLTSTPIGYDNTYVIDCNDTNTFIDKSLVGIGVAECYSV